MTVRAIVWPVVTASDWTRTAPPIALEKSSWGAAYRALRKAGYRVMHTGGMRSKGTIKADDLYHFYCGDATVTRASREIWRELPDDAEIDGYQIPVWPTAEDLEAMRMIKD